MSGFDAPYVPGWDCHGLPIEHQVDKELGSKRKDLSQTEILQRCRAYAKKFIDIQREEFKRLGVLGEWDNPYLTMDFAYEAVIIREFGRLALQGGVYKSKKPIYWCASCRTALAEAEVEYESHTSPSIFVAFPLLSDLTGNYPVLKNKKVSVLIWTTTPWTIPANLALAFHPEFEYVAVQEGDEVYILAKELLERVAQRLSWKNPQVLTGLDPRLLEGQKARHPLYDRESLMILANYVTLEDGTGIVHTAPGHGQEDYESGLRYHLDIYSPLDDGGRFLPEVGFFAGQFVFEANEPVKEKLREAGSLKGEETITHSYPHCWRCKRPVIFRATEQWFLSMETNELTKKGPGRDRPGDLDAGLGSEPDLQHDGKPSGLVPVPSTHLGGSYCGFLLSKLQQLASYSRDPLSCGSLGFETWNRDLVFLIRRTTLAPRYDLSPLPGNQISKRNRYPGCLVRLRCELRRGPGSPSLPRCPGRSLSGRERPAPGLVSHLPAGCRRDPG